MAGHPNAIPSYSFTFAAPKSVAEINSASAPASFIPSTTDVAIVDVLPVPVQNTTAILLIC